MPSIQWLASRFPTSPSCLVCSRSGKKQPKAGQASQCHVACFIQAEASLLACLAELELPGCRLVPLPRRGREPSCKHPSESALPEGCKDHYGDAELLVGSRASCFPSRDRLKPGLRNCSKDAPALATDANQSSSNHFIQEKARARGGWGGTYPAFSFRIVPSRASILTKAVWLR